MKHRCGLFRRKARMKTLIKIDKLFVRIPVYLLKVPKREIFDRSDFPDFYTIKSSWVGDLLVKILTFYFNL
jgi:hypothetical protein